MFLHKIALLVLLVIGVAAGGCCCCSNYVPGGISIPPSPSPGWNDDSQAGSVVGTWSSEGPYGTIVDPATGGVAGSTYNGEWYMFRADGTYRYVIMTSGIALSGGVVRDGKYRFEGGDIVLYDSEESWYPDPARSDQTPGYRNRAAGDEYYPFESQDQDTLSIDGHTFYRIKQD